MYLLQISGADGGAFSLEPDQLLPKRYKDGAGSAFVVMCPQCTGPVDIYEVKRHEPHL